MVIRELGWWAAIASTMGPPGAGSSASRTTSLFHNNSTSRDDRCGGSRRESGGDVSADDVSVDGVTADAGHGLWTDGWFGDTNVTGEAAVGAGATSEHDNHNGAGTPLVVGGADRVSADAGRGGGRWQPSDPLEALILRVEETVADLLPHQVATVVLGLGEVGKMLPDDLCFNLALLERSVRPLNLLTRWPVACGLYHVVWHVVCGLYHMACGVWRIACVAYRLWHVACGMWPVPCGLCHVACGVSRVDYGLWPVA
jgi:hypothetical protein